ncbi:MAG: BrnT family toxin [Sedimentisphaerales bacterium]|nr:BrnT family toxin [Sedimentisphaerales bacterium]
MSLRFEWNRKKALLNIRKHGITFEEASTIFGDPLSLTIPDTYHSIGEDRFITIGTSAKGRVLVVVHTERQDVIRIISARKPTNNERNQYELG